VGPDGEATLARFARRFAIAGATAAIVIASIGSSLAAPPSKKSGPGCLYGQVIDGHSGAIRCLSPEEVTPSDTTSPDGGADAGAADAAPEAATKKDAGLDAASAIPLRPSGSWTVAIEGLTFESGDVPRAPAALDRIKKDFAKCAEQFAGGPKAAPSNTSEPTIDLRFLVRAPGRAEGVDVVQSRGMSSDIVRCVASSLAGRPVGAPTSDPVAVSLTVRLKQDEKVSSKKE
jgi:hypothetical protein